MSFRRAAETSPEFRDAFVWVGDLLGVNLDPQSAVPYWQRAVDLDPSDRAAQQSLTLARNQSAFGIEAFEAYQRGVAQYTAGEVAAARSAFGAATRSNPRYADAWGWLGRIALEAGEFAAAASAYDRARQFAPENSAYAAQYALAAQSQAQLEAAARAEAERQAQLEREAEAARAEAERRAAEAAARAAAEQAAAEQAAAEAAAEAEAAAAAPPPAPEPTEPVAAEPETPEPVAAAPTEPEPTAEPSPPGDPAAEPEPEPPLAQTPEPSTPPDAPTETPAAAAPSTPGPAPEANAAPAPPRSAEPVTLLELSHTHRASGDAGSGAYSFFQIPALLGGDLRSPVDYASGTVFQRLEVLGKPSDAGVQYQLCLVPDDEIAVRPACSRESFSFSQPGVYESSEPLSDFAGYGSIDWSKGLVNAMLVLKDAEGRPLDNSYFLSEADAPLDLSRYYPMLVRYEAVIVPPGGSFQGW